MPHNRNKRFNAAQRAETAIGNRGVFSIPKGTFKTTGGGPTGRLKLRQPVTADSAPNPSRELSPDAEKTNGVATSPLNPFSVVGRARERTRK